MSEKLDHYEACELADFILNVNNPEEEYSITEEALCEMWNIDCDTFQEIANAIFKTIDFGISPLTQKPFVGFSKKDTWIAKKEVEQQFISAIINWSTQGKEIPKNSKGFIKTITSKGKPMFEILIRKPKE